MNQRSLRFEKFIAQRWGFSDEQVAGMWDTDIKTYISHDYHVEVAWAAWCEALSIWV